MESLCEVTAQALPCDINYDDARESISSDSIDRETKGHIAARIPVSPKVSCERIGYTESVGS